MIRTITFTALGALTIAPTAALAPANPEPEEPPLPSNTDIEPQQTLSFQRVLQRAAMHVRSAGRDQIDAGNLLISMQREPESYAVYLLQQHSDGTRRHEKDMERDVQTPQQQHDAEVEDEKDDVGGFAKERVPEALRHGT